MLTMDEARRFKARRKASTRAARHDARMADQLWRQLAQDRAQAQANAQRRRCRASGIRLRPVVIPAPGKPLTVPEAIVAVVCAEASVTLDDFRSQKRALRIVHARRIAASLCRDLTAASFPEIAAAMHRPTHSTIIAMVRRLPDVMGEQIDYDASAPTVGEVYERVKAAVVERRGAA